MLPALLALLVLGADPAESADAEAKKQVQAFLTRLDAQPLVISDQVYERIERNAAGEIIRLRLDEAKLTADDWRALEKIESLQSVTLRKSNVTDADIAHLVRLPNLKGLVISSTELTDDAIGSIGAISSLKSICMFDVLITHEGKENLKLMLPKLQMGYRHREK